MMLTPTQPFKAVKSQFDDMAGAVGCPLAAVLHVAGSTPAW